MQTPRRNFLIQGARSVISVGLVLTASRFGFAQKTGGQIKTTLYRSDIPLEAQREPVFFFRESTFTPYLGGYFEGVNARGEAVDLKLVKITAFKSSAKLTNRTRRTEAFALLFSASSELPLFAPIHRIKHGALGEFDLFLTRRNGPDGELFYEAVLNHLI